MKNQKDGHSSGFLGSRGPKSKSPHVLPRSFVPSLYFFVAIFTFTLAILFNRVSLTQALQDTDYVLDDSYLNIDRGEVERLLREYPANQEMVRSIGTQYYQIVNVMQVRHHRYFGLSTREGTSKGPRSQTQGMQAMQQSRIGKHYHQTSFVIHAFNHKFRLVLELNPTLIAPNVMQTHSFPDNVQQRERNELEMCYYHGTVEGFEWSAAAVRTCNGLSGIIHMGNETFIIHPFQGGDQSHKHPHVVFEAKAIGRQTCGVKRNYEWKIAPVVNHGETEEQKKETGVNYFIELALLLDKAMFDKRNGSLRLNVIHDALQIVNIADLYYRKLNTAISVVYIESWHEPNKLGVANSQDLTGTLAKLVDSYAPRGLFHIHRDTTMLISGNNFPEAGMAVSNSICTPKANGVVTDVSVYQPQITGVALAHMIGHNLNMGHDQDWPNCPCGNWYGCIMNSNIVGTNGIQPYLFSECSRQAFFASYRSGHALCLKNKPNSIEMNIKTTCGNGIVESGELCDCGSAQECSSKDPCCDPLTCQLRYNAECSNSQPCCEGCKYKERGQVCRQKSSECDIPEFCTGENAQCPMNTFKRNGASCLNNQGYCFDGFCPTMDQQCKNLWEWPGKKANDECYKYFNVEGHHNGHCGRDRNGNYKKCNNNDIMCGTLHCKDGPLKPTIHSALTGITAFRIMLTVNGKEIECKNLQAPSDGSNADLVRDGTKCGEGMICLNQTCALLSKYINASSCKSNHVELECSGHGVCSNMNTCYCNPGWTDSDCSVKTAYIPPPSSESPSTVTPATLSNETTTSQPGRIRNKAAKDEGSNTIVLVFGMVSVVGGVFVLFAMMALCYRRSTVPKFTSSYPPFNPKTFKIPPQNNGAPTAPPTLPPVNHGHEEIDHRILSFTQLPAYMNQHNIGMSGSMKNLRGPLGGPEDETGDETSAFLGTPNSVGANRFPEKGILKKFVEEDGSQSDNNEGLCEVERTLKSLNGYHEDILAALRVAAAQRGLGDAGSPPPQGGTRLSDGYPDYPEFGSEFPLLRNSTDRIPQGQPADDESTEDAGGPIRIRNLEDLLRQLEHHSGGRHLSPCGSEDIRLSETEADRHYRLHSADLGGDDDGGFVLGRYRRPGVDTTTARSPLSDYTRFAPAAAGETPEDDLDSNQANLVHTSTSEEEEDRTQISRSLTPRNVKGAAYNPSDESYGSESPLHINGLDIFQSQQPHPQHFPEYKH